MISSQLSAIPHATASRSGSSSAHSALAGYGSVARKTLTLAALFFLPAIGLFAQSGQSEASPATDPIETAEGCRAAVDSLKNEVALLGDKIETMRGHRDRYAKPAMAALVVGENSGGSMMWGHYQEKVGDLKTERQEARQELRAAKKQCRAEKSSD